MSMSEPLAQPVVCGECDEAPPVRQRPQKSPIFYKNDITSKSMSDDEYFIAADEYLEEESMHYYCYGGECQCLHILRDPCRRSLVAKYIVGLRSKDKYEKDSIILEWYKYATANRRNGDKTNWYKFPFDAVDMFTDLTWIGPLVDARMCTQAMYRVMGISDHNMEPIRLASRTTGVLPRHGNTGNTHNAMAPEVYAHLKNHFDELMLLGEVRATRVIATLVDGMMGPHVNKNENDAENVYLPISDGYRRCYYRYLKSLGYSSYVAPNGAVKYDVWNPNGEHGPTPPKKVCLTTYVAMWKREYPRLKVSRPAEDICEYCYRFANKHKYLSSVTSTNNLGLAGNEHDAGGCDILEGDDVLLDAADINGMDAEKEEILPPTILFPGDGIVDERSPLTIDTGRAATEMAERQEQWLLEAAVHVRAAREQRKLYQHVVHKAQLDTESKTIHSERTYSLVVDYGQNMELPVFKTEQPGCAYYYSPLTINNLGVVNHAHEYPNGRIGEHMHCHVYHEGVGKKGANNVASLIISTLRAENIMRENDIGGELNIVFDNCSGQNKNNTVLKLSVWLVELGYFKAVNLIFLIVGHTKNAADHLFNALKFEYRKHNIFTMEKLISHLSFSESITVQPTKADQFFDYDKYFDSYYRNFEGLVKQNHIFSSHQNSRVGSGFFVDLRESNLEEHQIVRHQAIKRNFPGRSEYTNVRDAVANRPNDMKKLLGELLQPIVAPGINPYKQIELKDKYEELVPVEDKGCGLYDEPAPAIRAVVVQEKDKRKVLRVDLKAAKKKAVEKLDACAYGSDLGVSVGVNQEGGAGDDTTIMDGDKGEGE